MIIRGDDLRHTTPALEPFLKHRATSVQGQDPEFHFTAQDFERVRQLIYQHAGIHLSESKKAMVYSRLTRRLRATGLRRFDDYLQRLEDDDGAEWEEFSNALTTNLTSFFRETYHFPLLAEHIGRIRHRRPLKLWCCAASTGEEPYSMAMTMVDLFASDKPPVEILATDIDTDVLARAAAGVYSEERIEQLSTDQRQRFFLKGSGRNAGSVRVRDELRKMISFQRLNLIDPQWPIKGPFDAIFCRNVMIYFDRATQRKILQNFTPLMASDALLFVGHSENFQHATDLFRHRGRTVYSLADSVAARAKAVA